MKNTPPDFNTRITAARTSLGMTQTDVIFELRQLMPRSMWIGQTTLHRLETATPEEKADPFLVNVLCSIYKVKTSTVSEIAANELDRLRYLLEHASPCITAQDDQLVLAI